MCSLTKSNTKGDFEVNFTAAISYFVMAPGNLPTNHDGQISLQSILRLRRKSGLTGRTAA
jgi:hypothetical protein